MTAMIQPQVELEINHRFLAGVLLATENQPVANPIWAEIEKALKRLEKTQEWLAGELGVSNNAVTKWKQTGKISRENLAAAARLLKIPGENLLGAPPVTVGMPPARETPLPFEPRPEVMEIPVLDVRASMGLGAAMPEQETVIDHLRLAGTWVRRHLPTISSTLNLAVISAYGNSMSPTFNDGDILLVDRGVSRLDLDTVYVLAFGDELYIKRIQRLPDRSVRIISDNKTYDPIVVPAGERDSIKVLGKVVWAWNGKTP